uniref:LIP1 domain-containing protein n=1 Tax=Glossina pallidipes TaxID=7398 RepID=A0A1A9Z515_GLOPL
MELTDGTESEEKSAFKDRYDIVTKNYVKQAMSAFLVISSLKDREAEQRHEQQSKDQFEEPEWFSCGPTSRLDTIKLCGFDDDNDRESFLSEKNNAKQEDSGEGGNINNDDFKKNRVQKVNLIESKWSPHAQDSTHSKSLKKMSPNKENGINNDAKERDKENIRKFVSHLVANEETQGIYKQTPICNGENLANFLLGQSYHQKPSIMQSSIAIHPSYIQQTQIRWYGFQICVTGNIIDQLEAEEKIFAWPYQQFIATNDSFILIVDFMECVDAENFQVLKTINSKSSVFRDLQLIYDFVQKTPQLCIVHYPREEYSSSETLKSSKKDIYIKLWAYNHYVLS